MMRIIHRQAVEHAKLQFCQPERQQDVPHSLDADVIRIAFVANGRMAVVNLEEPVALHLHQVLGGERPAEVGVVDVRKHRLAAEPALRQHGVDIALHDFHDIRAVPRLDSVAKVGRVDVDLVLLEKVRRVGANFVLLELVSDLLAGNHQEPLAFLQIATELGQRVEPDLQDAVGGEASVEAVRAVTGEVFFEGCLAHLVGHRNPFDAFLEDVVVGQGQEMVAVGLVPFGDHFGEIVAVAPERVRVQVALPPARRLRARGGRPEQKRRPANAHQLNPTPPSKSHDQIVNRKS